MGGIWWNVYQLYILPSRIEWTTYFIDMSIVPPFVYLKFSPNLGWGFTQVPSWTQKFPRIFGRIMNSQRCKIVQSMLIHHSKVLFLPIYDGQFLCFKLTYTQLPVQLDIQILGRAYTHVHNQFWNSLKTWGWDFTQRWDYTRVSTVSYLDKCTQQVSGTSCKTCWSV